MVELTGMLSVFIQTNIEAKKWLDGFYETRIGDIKLFAKIDKTTILIKEPKFYTVNSKLLDFKVGWMLLEQVKELHIDIGHEGTFRSIIESKILTLDEKIGGYPKFK